MELARFVLQMGPEERDDVIDTAMLNARKAFYLAAFIAPWLPSSLRFGIGIENEQGASQFVGHAAGMCFDDLFLTSWVRAFVRLRCRRRVRRERLRDAAPAYSRLSCLSSPFPCVFCRCPKFWKESHDGTSLVKSLSVRLNFGSLC